MKTFMHELRTAAVATLAFAVLVCCLYPAIVWLLAQLLFPEQANGSLLVREGITIGSRLIGQQAADPRYFHPRPSAAGEGYDAAGSGGSNLGPLSKNYIETVRQRIDEYRTENKLSPNALVPADAVTASASGLDPHISVQNARLQAPRVAEATGMNLDTVYRRIEESTEGRDLFVFGEPRVNVLMLNIALQYNR
jgi:potassium-transporting ATPase KdpC subunit